MDKDPQEPNENESQESNDNETHSTTEEGMIETPENVTVGMKELTDLLGISKEILPDFSNLGSIIPLLNARVKLLISASRELKNDYAQIKQEMEQVTTASKDETEKDNLIHDFTQKIHQLRDATLRLSSEFQKRIGSDISAEDMDAILKKSKSSVQTQSTITDLEQKCVTQRTLSAKNQKEMSNRIRELEIGLTDAQTETEGLPEYH